MQYDENKMILAVDSHYGIYSTQCLLERYSHLLSNKDSLLEEIEDIKNIDSDNYIDSCVTFIDNAVFLIDDIHYRAVTNENLWLVPVDMELSEDWFI